jgi:hypothetical protein
MALVHKKVGEDIDHRVQQAADVAEKKFDHHLHHPGQRTRPSVKDTIEAKSRKAFIAAASELELKRARHDAERDRLQAEFTARLSALSPEQRDVARSLRLNIRRLSQGGSLKDVREEGVVTRKARTFENAKAWLRSCPNKFRAWLYQQIIDSDDELSAASQPGVVMSTTLTSNVFTIMTGLFLIFAS